MGFVLGKRARVVISSILLLQPERINPELNQKGYNVKSDVWSLGITMVMPRAATSTLQPWGWDGVCAGGALPLPQAVAAGGFTPNGTKF